ncbi:MAG: NotI family restriction endonuclease [Gammaproteobacteria bacterium]|nr:NotI family restriction endonuclease [Gammaproteobacteria bacterium]
MPVVHELFGRTLTAGDRQGEILNATCPHMGALCNGGGNRDMARWPAGEQPLAPFFDAAVAKAGDIPCGVCSVRTNRVWAICPHRLLTFIGQPSDEQQTLFERVLDLGGFVSGDVVSVWSEVALSSRSEGVNYRLDYVLRCGQRPPVVVEIMTASTSGGNRRERTDIRNAFCDAVLFGVGQIPEQRQSPGVNVRQVWARMASQLVVKSQIVNHWGGRTIWVVQDALTDYIANNTGVRLPELERADWTLDEVNVLAGSLDDPDDLTLYAGPVFPSRNGDACWAHLLDTPSLPEFDVIRAKLRPDAAVAEFTVP